MGYFYPRQAILAPIGLVTEPNEYGQYPSGALKRARNVTLRLPGKLVQSPDVRNTVALGAIGAVIAKLMPADTGIVYALVNTAGTWSIFADAVAQTFVGSAVGAFSDTGRISWAQCAERVIVNGKFGNLVRDPTPISTQFRAAGLPQLSCVSGSVTLPSGWLADQQLVSYRACLARRYSGDYTLRSAPSVPMKAGNFSGTVNKYGVEMLVKWPAVGVEPGDIIELYRTNVLGTSSLTADPGATYKLVQEYTLTAADIAAPPAAGLVLQDYQAPLTGTLLTSGRELYTNPGVEGENYANLRPPIAQCLVSFKGFCFYANTTERAQLKLTVPAGLGPLAFAAERAKGIGSRGGAGTVTAGSAIITAVPAADILGVKVGQRHPVSLAFPAGATVIAVGAATITMSVAAAVGAPSWQVFDVIEIGGVSYVISSLRAFLVNLGAVMEAQSTQPVSDVGLSPTETAFELTLMWNSPPFDRSITVRATNGANYSPPVPELGLAVKTIDAITKKNRIAWSKEQQPEHAPSVSETDAGFGEIYAANATRDALWIWCSDGLFRLSGNAGSLGLGAWQLDFASATLLLCAPQASTVYEEHLYGYTNGGAVEIDSAGNLRNLTHGLVGDLMPGPRYREVPGVIMERNEANGEILLALGDNADGWSDHVYIYNVSRRGWTQLDDNNDELSGISAIAMFRLPPAAAEAHVLLAAFRFGLPPCYSAWNAAGSFLEGDTQYQPVYGDDPLELKRWLWADYLFAPGSTGSITALWNALGFGPIAMQALDAGVYARAGCPREVGLSHSISPGFSWGASATQRQFEGLSLAVKQRTNQSKKR